jgi:hypothetical protein
MAPGDVTARRPGSTAGPDIARHALDGAGETADARAMAEIDDRDAPPRYYDHDATDPLPVVLGALRGARDGGRAVVWNEHDGALAEIAQRPFTPTTDPTRVGLGLLMPDFDARMGNVGRNIGEGRLGIVQAAMRAV